MSKKVYIAGAHSRAQTLMVYLKYLYLDEMEIEAFLVDDLSENVETIAGIPVKLMMKGLHEEYPVYIGTRGVNHQKIAKELQSIGMQCIIPVTVELDRKLRNEYVRKVYQEKRREFSFIDEFGGNKDLKNCESSKKTAQIYVACSVNDQPLQSAYEYAEDEKVIQVGAALTHQRIGNGILVDCEGENISEKNHQYCELTGLYWIWKHAREDYLGLVHYRRHFLLPKDWMQSMEENSIDVILPVPLYVAPNLEDNFKSRHIASDWEFLMEYLKKNFFDEYEFAQKIFHGNLYFPCNMFVMRKEVLNELCSWMFPILDAVATHGGWKEDVYMNRYPGFISERLITYFFEKYKDRYKIVYANKNFLK